MRYRADYYESEESLRTPYAVSDEESRWVSGVSCPSLEEARAICEKWSKEEGSYKTSRIVEINDDGNPTSVVWMSVWEAPLGEVQEAGAVSGGASGVPGYSIKMSVWMHKDMGPPDHWPWRAWFHQKLKKSKILHDPNSWDLEYGRKVDSNSKMILWSIRLNIWPVGEVKHPSGWRWWSILNKDEDHQDEVEIVRIHDIEPRSFPEGVDLVNCYQCGKTHESSKSWVAYPDDQEHFCSCFCVDDYFEDPDQYRITPDGEERSEPGCVAELPQVRI